MKRLMDLLGDDGLDEFGAAQLDALNGGDSESGSDSDAEDSDGSDADGAVEQSLSDEDSSADEDDEVGGEDGGKDVDMVNGDEEDDEELAIDEQDDISLDEDAVPKQKVVIDNKARFTSYHQLQTIKLDSSFDWVETLSVTYPEPLDVKDPDNDLERELAFYKQALHSAQAARKLAASSKPPVPFTRPTDYYAEMVKSDSHMERVRQKLLDERAGITKSEEARRQRELKKVGKQVQVEKMKDRAKGRKEMEERLKGLKRKRGGGLDDNDSDFDIAVEDAISSNPKASSSSNNNKRAKGSDGKARMPRSARNAKFGFNGGSGGKRREKQNDRESANDVNAIAGGPGRRGGFGGRGRGGGRGGRGGKFGGGGGGRGGAKR
ncbi:eukaryotic rRNA processing [Clavulina sp. PMI_390]|nr:eukaryotic rRNA processing [Clavulina sp. PMI_390]